MFGSFVGKLFDDRFHQLIGALQRCSVVAGPFVSFHARFELQQVCMELVWTAGVGASQILVGVGSVDIVARFEVCVGQCQRRVVR